jgi:hypothetical protein
VEKKEKKKKEKKKKNVQSQQPHKGVHPFFASSAAAPPCPIFSLC